LIHGVFSRLGGVSSHPWQSLNLGGTVGDDPASVEENLARLLSSLHISSEQLAQVNQIHSNLVVKVERPMDSEFQGDAMITDCPELLLLMRFADCVPILYFDPVNRAVAIAHAGWKGTLLNVAGETVNHMADEFGTTPQKLRVGIGPSIGPDHYLIGEDVIREVKTTYSSQTDEVLVNHPEGVKFNLWTANRINLNKAGVTEVEVSGICTGCDLNHWYSHRVEKGRTGRFGAVIGIGK
jgi:YfiH family protein